MTPNISTTLRSRWFIGCVHVCLWVLLYLAIMTLRGKSFDYREGESPLPAAPGQVPTTSLETLFAGGNWPRFHADTNALNPFFTRHFIPPQATPATTRKIELTYQGFYQTAEGPIHAVYKIGEAFVASAVGAKITANLFISAATMQTLTLTNPAAQTTVVPLNVKKEIEVPIQ
jgi:hypothetical protein